MRRPREQGKQRSRGIDLRFLPLIMLSSVLTRMWLFAPCWTCYGNRLALVDATYMTVMATGISTVMKRFAGGDLNMSNSPLGRLVRADRREAWISESSDFTPWLAQEENLKLLGDTLGLELRLESFALAVE